MLCYFVNQKPVKMHVFYIGVMEVNIGIDKKSYDFPIFTLHKATFQALPKKL